MVNVFIILKQQAKHLQFHFWFSIPMIIKLLCFAKLSLEKSANVHSFEQYEFDF
jgi:hypothetical protein